MEGTWESQGESHAVAGTYKPMNGKMEQLTLWQSDQPVVVKKRGNVRGAKGLAVLRWDLRDTSARHRTGVRMRTKLESLTQRVLRNPHGQFVSLAHLLNEGFLEGCFLELKRDKAPGIDGVSVEEYGKDLDSNIEDLVKRLKAKKYRPQPARRTYVPKGDKDKRPLGIPGVEDKVVQMGVKKILEAIYEPLFIETSYGFRPKMGCHDALDRLDREIMRKLVNYIVDMDIRKFFDTVDHKWLMRALEQMIKDRSLLYLIGRMLKAGVVEEGKFIEVDEGTPQGSILSPMLANIYLHYVLDKWFERTIKSRMRGYCILIRYADDFVVCFQYGREAKEFAKELKVRLAKYGLKIAEEKSKVIKFGQKAWMEAQKTGGKVETFDFLGFTHYCDKSRRGNFKLSQKTSAKKYRQKLRDMKEWLRKHKNILPLYGEYLNKLRQKLTGHYQYYGRSGNMRMLKQYYERTAGLLFKWINRRSQKRSYTLKQFSKFLRYNPLPRPRIYHSTYTTYS